MSVVFPRKVGGLQCQDQAVAAPAAAAAAAPKDPPVATTEVRGTLGTQGVDPVLGELPSI